jgi:hypothetical protein
MVNNLIFADLEELGDIIAKKLTIGLPISSRKIASVAAVD